MDTNKFKEIKERWSKITEGPWSWEYIGEKVNGYAIGLAYDENGEVLSGLIKNDPDAMTDSILRKYLVGEHEATTCNYSDADAISQAPEDISTLVNHIENFDDEIVRLKYQVLACLWCPSEEYDRVWKVFREFQK